MKFTVPCKPFNAMVRSMKKIVKPADFRRATQRVHFQVFHTAPGAYYFRAMVTDGVKLYEDVIQVTDVEREDSVKIGSFDLPRLAAKSSVEIDATEDAVVISFDDVAFTSHAMRLTKDEPEPTDTLVEFVRKAQTGAVMAPGRISVCCNPSFLKDAAECFKECREVRLDLGKPLEPIIMTGRTIDSTVFRMVMPMRTVVSDQTYRDNMSRCAVLPTSAELAAAPEGGTPDE